MNQQIQPNEKIDNVTTSSGTTLHTVKTSTAILDRNFSNTSPKGNELRKIFNRHTIKINYSSMNNTKQIIDNQNKHLLKSSETEQNENNHINSTRDKKTCNCRQKDACPLNINCLQSSVIYQAAVTRKDNLTTETYVGLTENDFKTRHRNHTASFRHPRLRTSAELSKHNYLETKRQQH